MDAITEQHFDLLIIGGAMVGGSLALGLKESGLKIAIIDAKETESRIDGRAGERAIALSQGSVQLLDKLGLWKAIGKKAEAIETIHISDRGHFGKTRLSAKKEGVKALGYVATAKTIEMAIEEALEASDCSRFCPATLTDLEVCDDALKVIVNEGDKSLNLSCKLLVGADGGESTVRKLSGIERQIRHYNQTVISVVVEPELNGNQTAFERFTESGPLAFLPIENGLYSVVWTVDDREVDEMMKLSDEDFLSRLQLYFGHRLGRLKLVGERGCFPLSLVTASQMSAERRVLIGNASHQIHPVAGQGFNLGLRDAAQLAELLMVCVKRNGDPGDESLLKDFCDRREKDLKAVIGATDGLVKLFSSDFVPLALARNIGLVTLDHLPSAKSAIARFAMGMSGRLSRLERQEAIR